MTTDEQRAHGRAAADGCIKGLTETSRQMPYEARAAFWNEIRAFIEDLWPHGAEQAFEAGRKLGESWRLDE